MSIPARLQDDNLRFCLVKHEDKAPIEFSWNKPGGGLKWNDDRLRYHLDEGGNYGVICGSENKLVIVDFDNSKLQDIAEPMLPDTFTVKSGGKGLHHLYYFIEGDKKFIKQHGYCDVLSTNTKGTFMQALGPGSRIKKKKAEPVLDEDGFPIFDRDNNPKMRYKDTGEIGEYSIVKDIPITRIHADELYPLLEKAISKARGPGRPKKADATPKKKSHVNKTRQNKGESKLHKIQIEILEYAKRNVNLRDIMIYDGIMFEDNGNGKCPLHDSENNQNLSVGKNDIGIHVFHCFHNQGSDDACGWSGDIITYLMDRHNLKFIDACKKAAELADKKWPTDIEAMEEETGMPHVYLPGDDRLFSEFAHDIGKIFKNNNDIFYRPETKTVEEVTTYFDKVNDKSYSGFTEVTPHRLHSLIEQKVVTITKEGKRRSPIIEQMKLLLYSDEFLKNLYNVHRILNYPMLFHRKDKLTVTKPGYNEDVGAYVLETSPEMQAIMPMNEAKQYVNEIFKEFCFSSKTDYTMAVSALITRAARGLYNDITARTPIYMTIANQSRAGKDYLMNTINLIFEGIYVEEAPLSSDDRNSHESEETRKSIFAALMQGRRYMHFANCRGLIKNAAFEQATTSKSIAGRILGQSKHMVLPNEIEFSLSGNAGIRYTPDLWNRCRPIYLFYAGNTNERQYDRPDLQEHIMEHRSRFITAINSIIIHWVKAGMPNGGTFTSFPEWARVVGGICEFAEFGDPTVKIEDRYEGIGGDDETSEMSMFFDLMHQKCEEERKGFKFKEIAEIIASHNEENPDDAIFTDYNLYTPSGKRELGREIKKFEGRVLNDILMKMVNPQEKNRSRHQFSFIKYENS